MSNPLLSANNIVKRYANHTALNGVSINVEHGRIFGLLGPNGAGKTSLIRIINQITGPDEGYVELDGERLKPEHIKDIGYLPEERGLYKKMKVKISNQGEISWELDITSFVRSYSPFMMLSKMI